jgi:hypothetical protein
LAMERNSNSDFFSNANISIVLLFSSLPIAENNKFNHREIVSRQKYLRIEINSY